MEHFVKLWAEILDSSVWSLPPSHRVVWITLLAMAGPDGRVAASISGLARRANVPADDAAAAILALSSPDPESRCPDHDGRRIEPAERGWQVLNWAAFRARRAQEESRESWRRRKAEWRARRAAAPDVPAECPPMSPDVPPVTAVEVEVEVDTEVPVPVQVHKQKRAMPRPDTVPADVWADWQAARKAKAGGPVTATAWAAIQTAAAADGMTDEQVVRLMAERGWRAYRRGWGTSSSSSRRPGLHDRHAWVADGRERL